MNTAQSALPHWRRPLPRFERTPQQKAHLERVSSEEAARREAASLREATYDLCEQPTTFADLAAGVREEWGDASQIQIAAALSALVRLRSLRRTAADEFVQVEHDDEEEEA